MLRKEKTAQRPTGKKNGGATSWKKKTILLRWPWNLSKFRKLSRQDKIKSKYRRKKFSPDSDEVVWSMNLKQSEVKFDAEARSYSNQPGAVGRARVLLWVTRGENGPIFWCDVPTTWHWGMEEEGRKEERQSLYICIRGTGIQQHRSVILLQMVEKGDFSSLASSASLLSVSLPLSFALSLVPRRLSELKISQ